METSVGTDLDCRVQSGIENYAQGIYHIGDENSEQAERVMYLRFVVPNIDRDSQRPLGVFHAAGNLQNWGWLSPYEEEQYDLIREWFSVHLKRPTRFTASKPPYCRKPRKAISWFKDSAKEHIRHARSLAKILDNHGVLVTTLTARRVGYVVYEDEFQITAEPFAGERY
jgi:hypothetical protein